MILAENDYSPKRSYCCPIIFRVSRDPEKRITRVSVFWKKILPRLVQRNTSDRSAGTPWVRLSITTIVVRRNVRCRRSLQNRRSEHFEKSPLKVLYRILGRSISSACAGPGTRKKNGAAIGDFEKIPVPTTMPAQQSERVVVCSVPDRVQSRNFCATVIYTGNERKRHIFIIEQNQFRVCSVCVQNYHYRRRASATRDAHSPEFYN